MIVFDKLFFLLNEALFHLPPNPEEKNPFADEYVLNEKMARKRILEAYSIVSDERDKCCEWKEYPENIPDFEEDYIAYVHSISVLVYNGKNIKLGYLQVWKDEEYPSMWKECGRDGYEIDNVTHWMSLPEMPKEEYNNGNNERS